MMQNNTEIEKKITDHNHDKYTTAPEFNTLAVDIFNAWLAEANLITKTDFDAKLSSLDKKNDSNKTKDLLVQNEFKKLKTFDSSYFRGKSHFEEDGAQYYLVFQPMYRYFKIIAGVSNGSHVYYRKSKRLSDKEINSIKTSNYSVIPYLDYYGSKIKEKFNGICLKQDKITYTRGEIEKIYIAYKISKSINISDYPTLENYSFGAVSLTKNTDIDRYKYSGYGIGFDRHGSFSFPGTGLGRKVIIFGVDMSSSAKIDKSKKDILILGKGLPQGLEHTLSAEKMYSINFTEQLHYS